MDIAVQEMGQASVVELTGEIDGKTAPVAQEQIIPLIKPGCRLLLNMTRVTYMSSAGLRMMLMLYRQTTAKNGKIALVGLIEEIQDTMSATGFLSYFTVCDSVEAGLASLAA